MCQSLFLNKLQGSAYNVIKKKTLAHVFSCEFCEISKSTFSYRTPSVAASVIRWYIDLEWNNITGTIMQIQTNWEL